MNKLSTEKRAAVVKALVEGVSIRGVCRLTGVSKPAVLKLLVDLGHACAAFHDSAVRDVPAKRVQVDEAWSFVYAKETNVPEEKKGELGYGDIWTWVGIEAETKLAISWYVGSRDAGTAFEFMSDLASRLRDRIQLTSDGHRAYLQGVEGAFGAGVDYAQLVKLYGVPPEADHRYSPAECIGTRMETITGAPDPRHISTSFVERQNLTMRMGMRRFTRLTNGFSKKLENHWCAVNLHFVYYNFARVHQTLRVTPAMEAGLTDHVWSVEEIVGLVETAEAAQAAAK